MKKYMNSPDARDPDDQHFVNAHYYAKESLKEMASIRFPSVLRSGSDSTAEFTRLEQKEMRKTVEAILALLK